MLSKIFFAILLLGLNIAWAKCQGQIGPDPWDYESNLNSLKRDDDIPLDLIPISTKNVQTNNICTGDWFYKRILAVILKRGLIKKNDDGSVDISLQMRYDVEHWNVLEDYINSNTIFTEDMFRRSMGYVEEGIYKPTFTEKIVMAWTEYVQYYLIEYKTYFVWITTLLGGGGIAYWMLLNISHKHVVILLFVGFYIYEVLVSYMEAEKQELARFISAMNSCKWLIWSSTCDVPPPDQLIFLKHMNPLKIGIRMFSILITEPIIALCETMKIILHGITDGLWYPLDQIIYGFLMCVFLVLIIFFLVMIIFNYILNIPFNLRFLGIFSIGFKQRNRFVPKMSTNNNSVTVHTNENVDRISGETLSKLLDVCSKALNTTQSAHSQPTQSTNLQLTYKSKMSRSASTGRLPNFSSSDKFVK